VVANNLPLQATSFIGREEQIEQVRRLLESTRLLTLTGAGGCGKTRLSLRVAEDVSGDYADGVWFVDLAPLTDSSLVPQALAAALVVHDIPGRTTLETVAEHLRNRATLIVLDNCEHVIDSAAGVAHVLLRDCRGVRILATSREALRSPGETTWRVPSLTLPPPPGIGATTESMMESEGVRLFVDRARAALPGFELTSASCAAVQDICHQLDGIPLALELAAARVRVFDVARIAARLGDRFALLSGGPRTALPRQQTLRATVDWSYALLSEPERTVLRRLSVFAGGWTLDSAEAVIADEDIQRSGALESLAALVEKSLVVAELRQGAMRYRLLETIRQYARERLDESGQTAAARDRHLAYFLGLAEEMEPALRGPNARHVMKDLDQELGNFRSALDWALQTRPDDALALSGSLGWYWWGRDHHTEGRRWLARALAGCTRRSPARMKALHATAWLAQHQRDLADSRALLEESLAIARELADTRTKAWVLHCLARVAYFENDAATARSVGERSLAVAERIGEPALIAWAHHILGLAAYIADDQPTARLHYEKSLAIRRQLRFDEGIAIVVILLGLVALRQGKVDEACARYREGLLLVHDLLGPWGIAMPIAALAHIAATHGQPVPAVSLGAVATRLSEAYQTPLIPLIEPLLAESLDLAQQELARDTYAEAWAEGQSMSIEAAVAQAMQVAAEPQRVAAPREYGTLTAAEARVLQLLVEGSTTREIASQLVVAVSTVDRHITHIYNKLGVRNRAEATSVALKHNLVQNRQD
jgi:non-specific serine/threonine protein kinase